MNDEFFYVHGNLAKLLGLGKDVPQSKIFASVEGIITADPDGAVYVSLAPDLTP